MIVDALQRQSGLSRSRLLFLANSASQRYKVYTIGKRTGGQRVIEHPSRELKAIQRWLIGYLLSKFPTHKSATAYKEGASIRINALRHTNSSYTLRLDFSNFFGRTYLPNAGDDAWPTRGRHLCFIEGQEGEAHEDVHNGNEPYQLGQPLSPVYPQTE